MLNQYHANIIIRHESLIWYWFDISVVFIFTRVSIIVPLVCMTTSSGLDRGKKQIDTLDKHVY